MRQVRLLYLIFFLFTLTFNANAENHDHIGNSTNTDNCEKKENLSNVSNSQTVYICTGSYAYAYHSRSDCPGLNNCKGEIKYADENFAVNNLGRVPCCRCWSNVTGRCKDDNPYYGGSGGGDDNSEALAYIALAVVIASAAVLSNDIYIYPTYSFYKGNYNDNRSGISQATNSPGWVFGFRKTFKHSALEYGGSYFKSAFENNYGDGYSYTEENDRWGMHFNFVHQLFYNQTPYWVKVYLGPSLNYIYDFGYGGLIGTEIRIFDRLKFDLRYEYTTQTNQIQAGLIFTYQKKLFWQK